MHHRHLAARSTDGEPARSPALPALVLDDTRALHISLAGLDKAQSHTPPIMGSLCGILSTLASPTLRPTSQHGTMPPAPALFSLPGMLRESLVCSSIRHLHVSCNHHVLLCCSRLYNAVPIMCAPHDELLWHRSCHEGANNTCCSALQDDDSVTDMSEEGLQQEASAQPMQQSVPGFELYKLIDLVPELHGILGAGVRPACSRHAGYVTLCCACDKCLPNLCQVGCCRDMLL